MHVFTVMETKYSIGTNLCCVIFLGKGAKASFDGASHLLIQACDLWVGEITSVSVLSGQIRSIL